MARFELRGMLVAGGLVLAVLVAGSALALTRPADGGGASVAAPSAGESASRRADPAGAVGVAADAPAQAPRQPVPIGTVQRSLVRTAQLTVDVDDPAASARQVRTQAAAAGGFVTEEQSRDGGSWVVLRVPADSLDRIIDDVGGLGRVTARSSQVVDATEEVVDLDARVVSQEASVARVRSLLGQAESIGDVVAVESELARREADLDSLKTRLAALRDQGALSTLTVDLRGTGIPVGDGRAAGFLDGLTAGWDGLRTVGSALAAAFGFAVPFLPVLAVLAATGWLARRIVRARRVPAPAGASGRGGPGSEGES